MRTTIWLSLLVLVACKSGVPDPGLFRSEQAAEDAVDSAIGTDADGTQTDAIVDVADADAASDSVDVVEADGVDAQDAGTDAAVIDAPDVGTDAAVIDAPDAGTDAIVDAITPDAGTDAIADTDTVDAGTDAIADVQPDVQPDVFVDPCIGKNCSDGIACTTDSCATNGGCVHTPVNSACDDSTSCTTDLCNAATGCAHPWDGTTCNDGNACTSDVCTSGNGATGCSHSNIGGTCDDSNACTTADACTAGTCKGVGPVCGDGACMCGETLATCALDCTPAPTGMVLIPAGTFWMGCNATKDSACNADESPQHKVTLSGYYVDLTETTVAQYKACVDAGVCTAPSSQSPTQYATYPGFPNNPVNFVTWTQSQAYCKWRGAGFDLPTEAQWEMAARGSCENNGSTAGDAGCAAAMRTYPWGETKATCSYAVMPNGTSGCGTNATWAVGSKTAGDSPYGLHDMAGNVWEWNRDWYSSTYYSSSPATDPYDSASASYRVLHGGGFNDTFLYPRAGDRVGDDPSYASEYRGLRCIKSTNPCGNGTCDGDETVASCPADCSFLVKHLGGACTTPGSKDTCDHGYFCVARSTAGGGNVCVADISTWAPIADSHPASDFTEATDYVTDSKTGLSWAKAALAGMDWSTALTACNAATYGSFNDWRVPTRAEMLSLTDRTKGSPASSAPNMTWPTDQWAYWSSIPAFVAGDWSVRFDGGTNGNFEPTSSYRVRCVRGGTVSGTGTGTRFVTQNTDVLDRISGLHWDQYFSPTDVNHADAVTWCMIGSGWRLPTSHELEDLVDTQTTSPSIDAVFAGTPPDKSFWSATLASGGAAWFVFFPGGWSSSAKVSATYRVRCVR